MADRIGAAVGLLLLVALLDAVAIVVFAYLGGAR